MSLPICSQVFVNGFHLNTRVCPLILPFPSLPCAPIATISPSEDKNETDLPDESPLCSPSMSLPICTQVFVNGFHLNTRVCPLPPPLPFPPLPYAPIATVSPSEDNETELPDRSPLVSPSMSLPICSHIFFDWIHLNTRVCPRLLVVMPFPSLPTAPMAATVLPSADKETDSPDSSQLASSSMSTPSCNQEKEGVLEIVFCLDDLSCLDALFCLDVLPCLNFKFLLVFFLWFSCSSSSVVVVVGRGVMVVDVRKTGVVPIATRPSLALLLGHKKRNCWFGL